MGQINGSSSPRFWSPTVTEMDTSEPDISRVM